MTTLNSFSRPVGQSATAQLGHYAFGKPDGRQVIFLHAANQTGTSWADIAARLPEIRAICIDLPGTGQSAHLRFTTITDAADAVARLVRLLCRGRRVPIVGVSLGAYVGIKLMIRYPGLVHSAMLSGFQVRPIPGGWWLIPFGDALSPLMQMGAIRKRTARSLGISRRSSAWPGQRAPCSAATLRRVNREAIRFDVRDDLGVIKRPILAIAGAREAAPILNGLDDIRTGVPNSHTMVVPGGHGWPAQYPDTFAQILKNWIDEERPPEELGTQKIPSNGREIIA